MQKANSAWLMMRFLMRSMSNSNLAKSVSNFISTYSNIGNRHVVGVSGGADSMVLLALMYELKIPVIAVHYNFMLRGAAADQDQQLVEDFCQAKSIPFFAKRQDAAAYAQQNKLSIQEAAREMRYAFFREIMQQENAHKIITAHHADDQVETVLLQLFRASGLKGMAGMPDAENDILRPLLHTSKDEIYQFAAENDIPFREDASNQTDKYQRNYVRNSLLPLIEERFPQARQNMLQSAQYFKEAQQLLQQRMAQLRKKLLLPGPHQSWKLPIRSIMHLTARQTILFELFSDFGLRPTQLSELMNLLQASNGARLDLQDYVIFKDRDFLLIQAQQAEKSGDFFIHQSAGTLSMPTGKLKWQLVNEPLVSVKYDSNMAYLDAAVIDLPFRVRPVKTGDYFYPLGMTKKKKISRYMIDRKFSPLQKEQAMVLEMIPEQGNGKKRLMWLIGERIDNRFRISDKTSSYYLFQYEPNV